MEEEEVFATISAEQYPVLLIPKKCTALQVDFEVTEDVFIDLNVTSVNTEGNIMCIYSGFCNVKLVESYNINEDSNLSDSIENYSTAISEVNETEPTYNQSQVWMDPARSPYVYNNYDSPETQKQYTVYQESHSSHIMVEQCSTYITQNVNNSNKSIQYSAPEEFEHKKFRKRQSIDTNHQPIYEDDELQCGMYLTQLCDDIITAKENKDRQELKYIDIQSNNSALRQLMSKDIQSLSKQQRTILYLGHSSQFGQTIQNIQVKDPSFECIESHDTELDMETSSDGIPNPKKYQCDKCKQIFDQITAFKQHMIINHTGPKTPPVLTEELTFHCTYCNKKLKTEYKFEEHCMRHGDPDLECDKCHKVFASKFTLRNHSKIHLRKYPCLYCQKSFSESISLQDHVDKKHFKFICDYCDYATDKYSNLKRHIACAMHTDKNANSESGYQQIEFESTDSDTAEVACEQVRQKDIAEADSVIQKVVANKMFQSKCARRAAKYRKVCNVCNKTFDRISDLKRHLIEHVIRSTLAKTPVSTNGHLKITCEVCQLETFTKVDKYKAHLREHAQLTLYKCTFCDKSFSDSSNFSKHKKIHGTTWFHCDLCKRKFSTKKMITQHMEYHNNNMPVSCLYCDRKFHFESMLNKHMKSQHAKVRSRFRCKFCQEYFQSLKTKWDHEWIVHNVRKMIVDCLLCEAKFRKYSALKRHCSDVHQVGIPAAKFLAKGHRFSSQSSKR